MFDDDNVDKSREAPSSGPINRRNVLKSLATGGAIAAGVPVATAKEDGLSGSAIESILQKPEVEQIADITGDINISQGERKKIEVSGQQMTVTELESNYGTLTYSVIDSGAVEAKLTIEDLINQPTYRQTLADEYGSVPAQPGLAATLVSKGESVHLIREASSEEIEKLQSSVVRVEPEMKVETAVYDSEVNGFRVFAETPENHNNLETTTSSDISQYIVSADKSGIFDSGIETSKISNDDVTIQGCPFTLNCALCAKAVVDRGICLASCAKGPGPFCLACVLSSTFYPVACIPCVDQCA